MGDERVIVGENVSAILQRKLPLKCVNTRSILNFFLKKETSGNYHTKFRLSLREKQMLSMLSRGESNQEIAEEFGVKLKTIYTHRRNLMNKLGCKNRITFQKLFFNNKCLFK